MKIVVLFHKITDQLASIKNLSCVRFTLLCGFCGHKTGSYIRFFISLVTIITVTAISIELLIKWFEILNDWENILYPDDVVNDITLYKSLVLTIIIGIIIWIVLKYIYLIALVCALYAIHHNKQRTLKIVLYILVPTLVLDVFAVLGAVPLISHYQDIIYLIHLIIECYNLISIKKKYKQLESSSRTIQVITTQAVTASDVVPTPTGAIDQNDRTQPHCNTCSCMMRHVDTQGTSISTDPETAVEYSNTEEKTVNIKDVPIIFNQEQLEVQGNSLFDKRIANNNV